MDLSVLMRRIQQGDKEAFKTLYCRYSKTVYRIAHETTHNKEEAKRVVVAVFREALQLIKTRGPYIGDLYGWLDALTAKQVRLLRLAGGIDENEAELNKADTKSKTKEPKPTEEAQIKVPKRYTAIVNALLAVCALALIWVLVGLLGALNVFSGLDLGYSWFNQAVFKLF